MDFNKNNLIDETLDRFYETFQHTLDTADYVPEEYGRKIDAYIYKNLKAQFRRINREDRIYRRQKRKERNAVLREERKVRALQRKLERQAQRDKTRLDSTQETPSP